MSEYSKEVNALHDRLQKEHFKENDNLKIPRVHDMMGNLRSATKGLDDRVAFRDVVAGAWGKAAPGSDCGGAETPLASSDRQPLFLAIAVLSDRHASHAKRRYRRRRGWQCNARSTPCYLRNGAAGCAVHDWRFDQLGRGIRYRRRDRQYGWRRISAGDQQQPVRAL